MRGTISKMFSSTAHNAFSMWYASTVGGLRPRGGPLRDEEGVGVRRGL